MDYKKILASLAISTTVMLSVAGCLYQGTTVKNVDTSKTVITTQQKSTQEVLETSNTQQALKQGTVAYSEFANSVLDALGKGGRTKSYPKGKLLSTKGLYATTNFSC